MRIILWFLAIVCIILWVLGLAGYGIAVALGNLMHFLILLAIVLIVINVLTGRRARE